MNLSENLNNSFDYAKKMFTDAGRLIILIIISLIPIVQWISMGYGARVLRESPGSKDPPKLERYGELFVDGAKIFLAALIYLIVPVIIIFIGAASLMMAFLGAGFMTGTPAAEVGLAALGGSALVFLVIGGILVIVVSIVLAAALANMIKKGSFGKAFAFSEIFASIRKVGWGKYLAWVIIALVIQFVVLALLRAIPFVGWVISAIVSPIVLVFIARSIGVLFAEA